MFETDQEEDVIRHKPHKIIKFFEEKSLLYTLGVFILALLVSQLMFEATSSSIAESIFGFIFIFVMSMIPFHWGIQLGANIYKPQESYLTSKQLKKMNTFIKEGKSINISVNEDTIKLEDSSNE